MKSFIKIFSITLFSLIFLVNMFPSHVQAADSVVSSSSYTLLAPLPLGNTTNVASTTDINTYIPNVVKLLIGIAGALAVLRIIMGGIKYMTTEAFTGRSEAKSTIQDALIGLLLAVSAYVILYTVNPKLVSFQFDITGLRSGAPIGTDLGSMTTCSDGTPVPNNDPTQCPGGSAVVGGKCLVDSNGATQTIDCVCTNCVNNTDSLPFQGGVHTAMNVGLYQALQKMKSDPTYILPKWYITEAWPPTVPHLSKCHTTGTCIDLNIIPGYKSGDKISSDMVTAINTMYTALTKQGLGASFEASPSDIIKLKAAGVTAQLINASETTTAPSFHVTI